MTKEFRSIKLYQIDATPKKLNVRAEAKDDYEGITELAESMKRLGLLEPLIVRPHGGRYQIVAGNRRYLAAQELDWNAIDAVVDDEVSDVKVRRMGFIENVYREDLSAEEKAEAIAAIYNDVGLSSKQAAELVKYLHNQNTRSGVTPEEIMSSDIAKSPRDKSLVLSKKVFDAFNDIGLKANTQYRLLQMITELHPDIVSEATKKGLSMEKTLMLANPEIKKRPDIQRAIIEDIRDIPTQQAKEKVRKTIQEISEGGKSATQIRNETKERREDSRKQNMLETVLEIDRAVERLVYLVTGRALGRGEVMYKNEMINGRKDYIYGLLKAMGEDKQLTVFCNQIDLLRYLVSTIDEQIEKAETSNRRQRDLLKP